MMTKEREREERGEKGLGRGEEEEEDKGEKRESSLQFKVEVVTRGGKFIPADSRSKRRISKLE